MSLTTEQRARLTPEQAEAIDAADMVLGGGYVGDGAAMDWAQDAEEAINKLRAALIAATLGR